MGVAVAVGDTLQMLQYSTYSVISPEGCASILWKSAEHAATARATGRIVVWTDAASAAACARRVSPADASPADDAIAGRKEQAGELQRPWSVQHQ